MRKHKRLPVSGKGMRVKVYPVLEKCVEDGIAYGYRRAFKYEETPGEEYIKDQIRQAIMNALCEWFIFDEELE